MGGKDAESKRPTDLRATELHNLREALRAIRGNDASGYLLHFVQDGSSKNALEKFVFAQK